MQIYFVLSLLSLVTSLHSKDGNHCHVDSDCAADGWETCQDSICKHKEIWPLNEVEWWGLLLVAATLFYTSLAGVSGGGLVIPIAIGCMRFDARNAIALSNFSIFTASAMRFLTFSGEPHPKKNGKGLLVDHNLAVLGLPLIIMGVTVGILLNILVPSVLILSFFVIGCIYLACSMFYKGKRIYEEENE